MSTETEFDYCMRLFNFKDLWEQVSIRIGIQNILKSFWHWLNWF